MGFTKVRTRHQVLMNPPTVDYLSKRGRTYTLLVYEKVLSVCNKSSDILYLRV